MIEPYPPLIIAYIEAIQKPKFAKYGPSFEQEINALFPSQDFMFKQIETELEKEFGEDYDNRFELEAILKGEVLKEIPNLTKFESPQHKSLLNISEMTFRSVVEKEFLDKIPYNATLYSTEADAVIKDYPDLDKPIIFFHGGLFSANLMFSKLYVQLITGEKQFGTKETKIPYHLKNDSETIKIVTLHAVYFHNYHFSSISKSERSYSLKTNFENSLLAVLLESMTLFIYSHEVGHSYFKHYKNIEDKSTEEIWRDEFEADRFAMNSILDLYNNKQDAMILTLIGPIIFFKYRFLLEKYKPEIGAKQTHPPTMERMAQYYLWLEKVTRPEDKETMLAILTLEQSVSLELLGMFEKIHKVTIKGNNPK